MWGERREGSREGLAVEDFNKNHERDPFPGAQEDGLLFWNADNSKEPFSHGIEDSCSISQMDTAIVQKTQ